MQQTATAICNAFDAWLIVCHDWFICVCHDWFTYLRHDSFICGFHTTQSSACDMTHPYARHDSFICMRLDPFIRAWHHSGVLAGLPNPFCIVYHVCVCNRGSENERERKRKEKKERWERDTRERSERQERERIEPEHARQSIFLAKRQNFNGSLKSVTYTTMHGKGQRILFSLVILWPPRVLHFIVPQFPQKCWSVFSPRVLQIFPPPAGGNKNK